MNPTTPEELCNDLLAVLRGYRDTWHQYAVNNRAWSQQDAAETERLGLPQPSASAALYRATGLTYQICYERLAGVVANFEPQLREMQKRMAFHHLNTPTDYVATYRTRRCEHCEGRGVNLQHQRLVTCGECNGFGSITYELVNE